MNDKRSAFRLGVYVFLGLMFLTIVEFWVGVSLDSTVLLLIIALVKAGLIVQYFMHIARLWREESH